MTISFILYVKALFYILWKSDAAVFNVTSPPATIQNIFGTSRHISDFGTTLKRTADRLTLHQSPTWPVSNKFHDILGKSQMSFFGLLKSLLHNVWNFHTQRHNHLMLTVLSHHLRHMMRKV